MLDEGSVYNSQLWEYSLLRLNQLEYFEPLKVEQDSTAQQDSDAGTVTLLLKVKEKGKNSIGMNGGISGMSGRLPGRETTRPTTSSAWRKRSACKAIWAT